MGSPSRPVYGVPLASKRTPSCLVAHQHQHRVCNLACPTATLHLQEHIWLSLATLGLATYPNGLIPSRGDSYTPAATTVSPRRVNTRSTHLAPIYPQCLISKGHGFQCGWPCPGKKMRRDLGNETISSRGCYYISRGRRRSETTREAPFTAPRRKQRDSHELKTA